MIKYAKKLFKEKEDKGLIYKKVQGDLSKLNAKVIFDCAKEGDNIANQIVERFVKYLSIGIVNLINILDPQIIVLGGGVANAGKYLLDLVIREVEKAKHYKELPIGKIVLAEMRNTAGIIGATMLGKQYK